MINTKEYYSDCSLCPNNCHVDRTNGQVGRCGRTDEIKIAWAGLHRGEEPPISGEKGSGMIFFCGCPLHCQYCQNYQISSKDGAGIIVSEKQLSQIMIELQKAGAHTLNLVTGTHYIPSIINAIESARENGFNLKVVWNSSGYENAEALRLIDKYIDLYLFDVKTLDCSTASKFCGLEKYATAVVPAVSFLRRRHPQTDLETNLSGILIRHLVFPGELQSTVKFINWYADNLKDCSKLSLMTQFVPPLENPGFKRMTDEEYEMLNNMLDEKGIDGFIQEREENEILWIPDFNKDQPFPQSFADPLDYFLVLKSKISSQCNNVVL